MNRVSLLKVFACRSKTLAIAASRICSPRYQNSAIAEFARHPAPCPCALARHASAHLGRTQPHVMYNGSVKANMYEQIRLHLCIDRMCCGEEKPQYTRSGLKTTPKKVDEIDSVLGAWGRVCKSQEQVPNALLSLFKTYASTSTAGAPRRAS